MATIKSYTDIEQSRKLATILPLESADMYWWYSGKRYYIEAIDDGDFNEKGDIRAWSLVALLSMLDFPSLTQNKEDEWEVCVLNHKSDGYIEVSANNPVDACVAMIEKLHELNLL
jgi:hypothetical protein